MNPTDLLHRQHCPLCSEREGNSAMTAEHFVEELYRRYAPRYAQSTMSGILLRSRFSLREKTNEQEGDSTRAD